jgi:hypothetical protein
MSQEYLRSVDTQNDLGRVPGDLSNSTQISVCNAVDSVISQVYKRLQPLHDAQDGRTTSILIPCRNEKVKLSQSGITDSP